MRLAVYGGASFMLALGVVLSALHQNSNFYAACVYLSKSSSCVMVLLNLGLLFSIIMGKTLQSIFFGQLRAIEVEHLYERSWYAVTETCLAMTIFREEFDLQFVLVFATLLFLKIFHWLCQDRVEFMEQSPSHRMTFHVRMVNLMALLLLIDILLACHAINVTITKGPNMMIMFGFEYTILICIMTSIIGKYILNVVDMRSQEPWEGKSMYVFYLDLVTDFFKLITYIVFFIFLCFFYQLPLHIVRDVYVTFRSFIQKCRDLYRYRRATRNMNELYPDASAEDLLRTSDSTCIICREEMHAIVVDNNGHADAPGDIDQNLDQPKKLPCGHIFHFYCLRSWLERQQSCPTCRRSVLSNASQPTPPEQAQAPPAQAQEPPVEAGQNNNHTNDHPLFHPQDQTRQHSENNQHNHFNGFHSSHTMNQVPHFSTRMDSSHEGGTLHTQHTIHTPLQSQIPGMIPLIPLLGQNSGILHSNAPGQVTSVTLPESLNEEQLQTLAETTRESMVQRLRLLEGVQSQIFHSMQILAEALSVVPTNDMRSASQSETSNAFTSTSQPTGQSSSLSPNTSTTPTSSASTLSDEPLETSSSNKQKKGKMPDYSTRLEDVNTNDSSSDKE